MMEEILKKITTKANEWYDDPTDHTANEFLILVGSIVDLYVNKTCIDSNWDKDELYSTLLLDSYKLLTIRWSPNSLPFHALLLHQLRNKCRNFVVARGRKKNNILVGADSLFDIVLEDPQVTALDLLVTKDLTDKLVNHLKANPNIRHQESLLFICELYLIGHNSLDIMRITGLRHMSFLSRMNVLKRIVNRL